MASTAVAAPPRQTVSPRLREAWDRHAATVEEMRAKFDASDQFAIAPDQKGMAYRQLLEAQAMAYNFAVAPRTAHPRVFHNTTWQTEIYSIGGNGPDFDYRLTFLDGRHDYRLTGRFRDSVTLLSQLNSALPGSANSRCIANYDFAEFDIAEDGSFEVTLSARKHDGNWVELLPDEDYQWMMFRPTAESWDAVPAELRIERISPIDPDASVAEEFDEEAVARRIEVATAFFRYILTDWAIGYVPLVLRGAGETNKFFSFSAADGGEMGSPVAQYLQCVFEVEDDEALILEFDEEPNGPYWSLQLYDIWQHALPFRTRQTTLHGGQMAKEPDGSVRVVLSRRDPGVANWLDNSGYTRGEVTWRNYLVTRNAEHRIHRVKFAELDAHLPATTARITPEERAAELARRQEAYLQRHGE